MFMLVIHVDVHASNTSWCSCYVLLYKERVVMPHYFCCKSNLRCRRSMVMVYMRRVHHEWRNLISFGGLVWIIFFVFCIVFSEFLSYNLVLNSGKKIRALRDKKKNILTRVVRKKILNETKNYTPPPLPCKLNGRSLNLDHNSILLSYLC